MAKKIFIGGLNYRTTEAGLLASLSKFGHVTAIRIITDRETGQSKGFGFATFADDLAADKAIEELNGKELDGRRVGVKVYLEKPSRGQA